MNKEELKIRISQEIDRMIEKLKFDLLNPATDSEIKRGLWDRVKNTMSNLWWGRKDQNNPYFWKNQLGDYLGQKESTFIPLKQYGLIKNHTTLLETALDQNTESLMLIKIINKWGQELKRILMSIIDKYNSTTPLQNPTTINPSKEIELKEIPFNQEKIKAIKKVWADENIPAYLKSNIANSIHSAQSEEEIYNILNRTTSSENMTNIKPMTGEKQWTDLTMDEKRAWNKYGGGKFGVYRGTKTQFDLPYILRIGDPRRKIITQHEMTRLSNKNRIEDIDFPIQNLKQLEARVEEIKKSKKINSHD